MSGLSRNRSSNVCLAIYPTQTMKQTFANNNDSSASLQHSQNETLRNSAASVASATPADQVAPRSSDYWTITKGVAIRTGFSCRECKKVILQGENVAVRDGRKMRFFYHEGCYAGVSDPRAQPNSSFQSDRFKSAFQSQAPPSKGRGKWSVSQYGYNDNAKWK
ncbi:hypothetical protein HDU77_009763 [Chytriomyces hyalinus]|nr:hypothetical protein HDU77_009763 [Chytriomyces hyalinus]